MNNDVRRLFSIALALCVVLCTALPGVAAAASYPPGQLSEADMQILTGAYDDIRMEFEQGYLPHFALDERSTDLATGMLEQDTAALDWVHFIWTALVSEVIFGVQKNSADAYQLPERQHFSDLTSDEFDQLLADYAPLMQEAGLSSDEQFDVSFAALAGNGVLMLLDFKHTDSPRASKYIGIAAEEDGKKHYYFAESLEGYPGLESFPEMGDMFFCGEFMPNGEANYWYNEATEAAFVESIHASLKGELQLAPILYQGAPEETTD